MKFWQPQTTDNGWFPKLSPGGQALIFGTTQIYGVRLDVPTPVEQLISTGNNSYSLGFLNSDSAMFSDFDNGGTLYNANPINGWQRVAAGTGPNVLGNYMRAARGHWATFTRDDRNAPGRAANPWIVDGRSWTPRIDGDGFALDGGAVAYKRRSDYVPIVDNIGQTATRIVTPPGDVYHMRVFEGPNGAYLFYEANGRLYINTPANENIEANLPGCSVQEGFGALSWRDGVLWVWTYANVNGVWSALGRPAGDSAAIVLDGIGANHGSMGVAQTGDGWTVCGSADSALGVWSAVPFDIVRRSYAGSSGIGTPVARVLGSVPSLMIPEANGKTPLIVGIAALAALWYLAEN